MITNNYTPPGIVVVGVVGAGVGRTRPPGISGRSETRGPGLPAATERTRAGRAGPEWWATVGQLRPGPGMPGWDFSPS